jgi:hypothetical protein
MSKQANLLRVIEQRTVVFYDDELAAVRADDGQIYAPVRQMCEALGLDRASQARRIQRHDVLADGYQGGVVWTPPSADGRGGGNQQTGLLRVDLIPLWLAGVRVQSVKPEIRPKLKQFQKEAAQVLWEAYQEGRLTRQPLAELLETDSPAAQAYKMAQAIMQMARQQLLLEAQLETHTSLLSEHEQRLEQIEDQLGATDRQITPEQAMHISQAVKAIALEMGRRSGRNEFNGVYGELYRRFKVPSYRELPATKFDEAMAFLRDWWQAVTDVDEVPF